MLEIIFLICAVVGGTVLVLQFFLLLIGIGGDAVDVDVPHDIGGGDVGGDFDGDMAHDVDHGGDADHHVGSSWLFGVISFRTIIAAMAFFGLGGLGAEAAGMEASGQMLVGVVAGLAAMYAVYSMVLGIGKLKAEGTPRIERTVGQHATVYTTIPAEKSGSGKIQINLQNRTMEYLALTLGSALSPGAKVVVTDVVTSDTVHVEPVVETEERDNHV